MRAYLQPPLPIFCAISHSSSPHLYICCLSLPHSHFPPHNTPLPTTTAKGLASAAHPKFSYFERGPRLRKRKREERGGSKKESSNFSSVVVAACSSSTVASSRTSQRLIYLIKPRISRRIEVIWSEDSGSRRTTRRGRSWTRLLRLVEFLAFYQPSSAQAWPDLAPWSSGRRWQTALSQDVESGWLGDDCCAGGHGSVHQSAGAVRDVRACWRGR